MDQAKTNFYENQILEAIETVANGIVSKIKFDQTILCTITNDKNRKKGIYEVTDGTSTFEACSNDDSYRKDMVVYVLIPQGNYENQKTIIGKYVDDTSSAINYISMMDSFISVNGSSNDQEYSLIANHPDRKFINIPINVKLEGTNQYNCVGIQADFKTDLSQEHIIAGNYGLILTLYGEDVSTEQSIAPKSYGLDCSEMYGDPYNYNFYFTQSMVFDLAKDFANTKITNATISFYQNKNFKTLDNEELSYTYSTTHTYIDENGDKQTEEISRDKQPNLFVKNIVLKFGYNLSDITEESIRLYSLNDTKYINRSDKKNISLKWFVKNEIEEKLPYLIIDNEEEAENEKLIGDYSIYWYRYKIDNSTKDPLAGVYWNIIPEGIHNDKIFVENKDSEKNELIYILEENPEGKYAKVNDAEDGALILATDKNTIKYDVTISSEGKRYNDTSPDELENPFEYTFGPNELLSREKIKAILVRNEWKEVLTEGKGDDNNTYVHFEDASKYYESNELVYENANPASQNLASVDLIRNMKLECQDRSNGIYKVYNSVDNKALGGEANRIRILNVIFDTYSTIDIPTAELENCSIKWKIPKNNSMIEPVDFSFTGPIVIQKPGSEIKIEENDKNETTIIEWKTGDDDSYYECNYPWSSSIAGKDEHHEGALLYTNYRIKEDYSQAYNNNTIICEITKYNRIYRAEIEFLFGESGTNGTGYTLSIRLDKEYDSNGNVSLTPVSCITADENKKVKLVATLFDQFGNDISDQQTVSWNFKNGINKGLVLDSNYIKYDGTEDISECYGIIMATSTVKWKEKTINLQAYLPIGIKPKNSDIFTYNGTTKIIYDAQGIQSTYQQIHNLYDKKDNDIPVNKWQVSVLEQEDDENWSKYIPYFVKDENDLTESTNILATKNMYFIELSTKQIVIQALNNVGDVLYQQSILYDQNRFGSALFNEWDGSLVIDEDGNKILSALIGAGKKDTNNTFSGVLMGDFTQNGSIKTGLLGFKDSVETFGFHTDGTAFIGPSGQGRIAFDGTKGIIESYTGNTKLNLTTGEIYLANDDEQSAKIILDSTGTSGYFSIKDKANDKNLIYIGSTGYYLQSKNFVYPSGSGENEVAGAGVRFDLNSGKLIGYDFLIQAGQGSKKLIINSDSESNPLTIGSNFYVDWDGNLYVNNGKFIGMIEAKTGSIGGWNIDEDVLYYGWTSIPTTGNSWVSGTNRAIIAPKGVSITGLNTVSSSYTYVDLDLDEDGNIQYDAEGNIIFKNINVNRSNSITNNIVFNVGKNFAIDTNGVLYVKESVIGGYATDTDLSSVSSELKSTLNTVNLKLSGDIAMNASNIGQVDLKTQGAISNLGVLGNNTIFLSQTYNDKAWKIVEGIYYNSQFYPALVTYSEPLTPIKDAYYKDLPSGDYYQYNGTNYNKIIDGSTYSAIPGYYNNNKIYAKRNMVQQDPKNETGTYLTSFENNTVYLSVAYDDKPPQAYIKDTENTLKLAENEKITIFSVSSEGLLYGANAVISGTIYATNGWFSGGISAAEGKIGNWEITGDGNLIGYAYSDTTPKTLLSTTTLHSISGSEEDLNFPDIEVTDELQYSTIINDTSSVACYVINEGSYIDEDTSETRYKYSIYNAPQTYSICQASFSNSYQSFQISGIKNTSSLKIAGFENIDISDLSHDFWLSGNYYYRKLEGVFTSSTNKNSYSYTTFSQDYSYTRNASMTISKDSDKDEVYKFLTGKETVVASDSFYTTCSMRIALLDTFDTELIFEPLYGSAFSITGSTLSTFPLNSINYSNINLSGNFSILRNGNIRIYPGAINVLNGENEKGIIYIDYDKLATTQIKNYLTDTYSLPPLLSVLTPSETIWSIMTAESSDRSLFGILGHSEGKSNYAGLVIDSTGNIFAQGTNPILGHQEYPWNNIYLNRFDTPTFKNTITVGSSNSFTLTRGGFHLNSTTPSNEFWQDALYTYNTVKTNTSNFKHYVGFIRAAGETSAKMSNVFVGCKYIVGGMNTDFPTSSEWSSSSTYNFYIRFDGKIYTKSTIQADGDIYSFGYIYAKQGMQIDGRVLLKSYNLSPERISGSLQIMGTKTILSMDSNTILVADYEEAAGVWKPLYLGVSSVLPGFPPSETKDGKKIYHPIADANLGSSNYPWATINGKSLTVETTSNISDARLKDIQYAVTNNQLLSIYNNLNPITYKYKNLSADDNHSRTHIGFLAQDVEKIIENIGLTSEDFAAVQIVNLDEPIQGCEDGKKYYLNYNEFHGLHVLKNQEQDSRIQELENKVQELEQQILELRGKGV